MHRTRRPLACRRAHRPVRLVDSKLTPSRRPSPLGPETAAVYKHGLIKVRHMRELFPDFYQQHIAWRQLTPRALYAAVSAFLSLINRHYFVIEDHMEFEIPLDPLQALAYTEDDTIANRGPLLELETAGYWLAQPQPVLYGVGVEGMLEDETPQSALTLALWRLCQETEWAIGVDVAAVIGFSWIAEPTVALITSLRPLPSGIPMDAIADAVTLPGGRWSSRLGELIRYAFARTGNPMADVNNYEVEVIYGGDTDYTWDDVREIGEYAAEARELVKLYYEWGAAIEKDPERELRTLEKALHAAARPHVKRANAQRTLIEILAADDPEYAEVEP